MARKQRTPGGPFAPVNFTEKHLSKLFEPFSGHCMAIMSQNYPKRRFKHCAAFCSRCKMSASKAFFPLLFCCFSCPIFVSSAGHLLGFISVGNVFGKDFRILEFDDTKDRWIVKTDFHGNFQVNATRFFCLLLWPP